MARKRSASRSAPRGENRWTRVSKHDNLPGRHGGRAPRSGSSAATLQLLYRLRRLELIVTYLNVGKPKGFPLAAMLDRVLALHSDAGWSAHEGSEVQVSQKRSATGETPRKAGTRGGLEGWSNEQIRAELESLEEAEDDEELG